MPDKVRLHGRVSDSQLVSLYSQAHLFAMLPHRIPGGEGWEGYGIVYLEAAAMGLPILAAKTGGVVEAVAPNGSVLLDEDCRLENVSDALAALMSDSEARRAMGKANVHWAQSQRWANKSELVAQLVNRLEAGGP
jgi:phosphatidylinositol alpha-1,6-mannosyltransferase